MNQHMLTLYALICDNVLYELSHINHRTTKGRDIVATLNGHLVEKVVFASVERSYVTIRNERDNIYELKVLRGKVRIFVLSECIKDKEALEVGGIRHNKCTNRAEMCVEIKRTIEGTEYKFVDFEEYIFEHTYGKCPACGKCLPLKVFSDWAAKALDTKAEKK